MLRPTFYSFETAKRALSNAQLGLDITGHNVTNAGTTGYTRQRLDQVSFNMSYNSRYRMPGNATFTGLGSMVTGITQIRDPYLDRRFREEASESAEYAVKSNGLGDLANIFDEIMDGGVDEKLSELIAALTQFQEDSSSTQYAAVVRSSADQLCKLIQKYNAELNGVKEQQHQDFKASVDEVNQLLESIAALNDKIFKDNAAGSPAYELIDARNLLLDQLSEYVEIEVDYTTNGVQVGDSFIQVLTVTIKGDGTELINGKEHGAFAYDGSGDPLADLTYTDAGGAAVPAAPATMGDVLMGLAANNGGLKGYLQVINGGGTEYGSAPYEDFRGIAYCQAILDDLASNLIQSMNALNASNGGGDLLTGSGAGDIAIDQNWLNNPLAIVDDGSNTGILAFVNLLTKDDTIAFGTGNKTFQGFLLDFQAQLGMDKALNDTLLKASSTVLNGLANQRDAISAVDADEEAINMMVYQNYYNAAARFMTVLDEALGTIIQGMGVVGR